MKDHRDELGATAVEYALMASFIAGVIVLAVAGIGGQLSTLFETACKAFVAGGC